MASRVIREFDFEPEPRPPRITPAARGYLARAAADARQAAVDEPTQVALDSIARLGIILPPETALTLAEQAEQQEGHPIPGDQVVRVILRDPAGFLVDGRDFAATDGSEDLQSFVARYVSSMAAEGMSGSVDWNVVPQGWSWEGA